MARVGQYLTDLERLAKYRLMADQAHECARRATSMEAKNAFVSLAATWESLIGELERMVESEPHHVDGLSPDAILAVAKAVDLYR